MPRLAPRIAVMDDVGKSIEAWWPKLRQQSRDYLMENNGDEVPADLVEEITAAGGIISTDAWWVSQSGPAGLCLSDVANDWIDELANGETPEPRAEDRVPTSGHAAVCEGSLSALVVTRARPPALNAAAGVLPLLGGRVRVEAMGIRVRPATDFADVATMLGPKRPDANVCWCLSYRIPARENHTLLGTQRGEKVAELMQQGPPGVLAYDGNDVVGWAAVHPRDDTSFANSRKIPHVDDLDVWSVWCIRVRPGHRGKGLSHVLLAGAVEFARHSGAPAIEGYPVDNQGQKVDLTMAYVGTRALFEKAGFCKAADTDSVINGFPRVLMRIDLR